MGAGAMKSAAGSGAPEKLGELRKLADLVSVERLAGMPRSAVVEALLRQRADPGASPGSAGAPRWHSAV